MTAGSGVNPLGKALFFLMAAFLLLIAPSLKLLESYRFSQDAIIVDAEIIQYDPEVQGMAGGLFMAAYHAGEMVPLLYLLKLAAVVSLLFSGRQFFLWGKVSKKKGEG